MISLKDFRVGDTVYIKIVENSNASRGLTKERINTLIPAKVTSVGRKYVTTSFNPYIKFEVSTSSFYGFDCLVEHNNCFVDYLLFRGVELYQNEVKRKELLADIRDTLNRNNAFSLDCLLKIQEVLNKYSVLSNPRQNTPTSK